MESIKIKSNPSVFISYNWSQSEYTDLLEATISGVATVIRDKNNVTMWGSLTDFMKSIRKQDFAILLISDEYLKSVNCMFEVSQLVKDDGWESKVMFIVFDSAKVYNTSGHSLYIGFWQQKRQDIEVQIESLPKQSIDGLVKDLRKIDEIQLTISSFLTAVQDSKNPKPEEAIPAVLSRITLFNFTDCEDLRTLFQKAISILGKIMDTDYNQLIMSARTATHNTGLVVVADKISKRKQKYRITEQSGIIANCFAGGKTLVIDDVSKNPDYFNAVPETAAEAVIPINHKGRTIGVFNSESEIPNYYTDEKIATAEALLLSFSQQLIKLGYKTNVDYNDLPYVTNH